MPNAAAAALLYIYALTHRAHLPRIAGHDDLPVVYVPVGSLMAAVTRHAEAPKAAAETLRCHEHVVEALMGLGGLLPQRFGTVAAEEESLRRNVEARIDGLIAALALVRDRVELALRVVPREGRADRDALVRLVHTPLAGLAFATRLSDAPAASAALAAAYLVHVDGRAPFESAVATIAARRPDLAISCTGPWPPYSFADG
jgi:hypothetical protein